MSLHVLAEHMASKGRNGDSMLVHMTPGEVAGLHALAIKHGGQLTINPETGLPEANFLKKLLPLAAGFLLGPAGFGIAESALGAAAMVGGATTLGTGSLQKGLMAGLGAYGGFGLGEALAGAGAGALSSGALGSQALDAAGYTSELAAGTPLSEASALTHGAAQQAPIMDRLAAGVDVAKAAPMEFLKQNSKYLMAAAAPIMADTMVPTTTKMPTTGSGGPAYIRQKLYDPYTQTYKSLAPVEADKWGSRSFSDAYTNPQTGEMATLQPRTPGMATGGIVALAAGGAGEDAAGGQTVADLYRSIGRTPDQEGLAFWQNAFGSGPVTADQAASFMQSANAVKAKEATAPATVTAPASGLSPSQTVYYNQLMTNPNANAADNLGYVKGLNDYQALASLGVTSGNLSPDERALITGQNGYGAVDMLANKYGVSGPVSMGQGQAYNPATSGVASLTTPPTPSAPNASGVAALQPQTGAPAPTGGTDLATAKAQVTNMYRNVLGRDPDPEGLNFWSNAIAGGRSPESIYNDFLASAKANTELVRADQIGAKTFAEATTPYTGYTSPEGANIADEWVRNVLGREPTEADKRQQWYQDTFNKMHTQEQAKALYKQFTDYAAKEAGKGTDLNWMAASQLKPLAKPVTTPQTYAPPGTRNPYGNEFNPGDLTYNPDGTITVQPNIPGRPYGGFTGMEQVKNAYTRGGGSLGYVSPVISSAAEHEARYNRLTGDSQAAYNYLMGRGANPIESQAATSSTGIMRPYFTGGKKYTPRFLTSNASGVVSSSTTNPNAPAAGITPSAQSINVKTPSGVVVPAMLGTDGYYRTSDGAKYDVTGKPVVADNTIITEAADGGLMGYSVGGGLGTLGGYSDGGRLLKGPGDGVSDSIPATIGANRQPARLADGEFVVPARIVSELGNGSTDAGAKKLYAMMDRVQKARGKTTGKNKVAANSRADKYLPA